MFYNFDYQIQVFFIFDEVILICPSKSDNDSDQYIELYFFNALNLVHACFLNTISCKGNAPIISKNSKVDDEATTSLTLLKDNLLNQLKQSHMIPRFPISIQFSFVRCLIGEMFCQVHL
ncbi:hypothetical protein O6H91_01G010900 [Diphasiastrum complanatum]|uniref:Uncharacterized protein n=1 Tax=Diphasiastrum complanatum TaxID=34168 RepID=A0ACC2EN77_DIPCM|nr:hypothetical protein O6H91_01G010900 [Diphasiastrum complanatum]